MQNSEIEHATVVITGATSGIGRAIALAFAKAKANLVLAARNESNLLDIKQECLRLGAHAVTLSTDVTELESMETLAAFAASSFDGPIAVWVNNAGIGTVGEFTETPLEAHVQVVKTNLLGYMNGCFAVLPYFKKQGSGTIINLNSLGAFVPLPFASGYSASKFGLLGFMEALRGELAADKNIHVCDIYPVSVNTPGYRHAGNYVGALLKPIPPMIDSETVAETVLDVVRSPRAQTTLGWPSAFARIGYALFPGLTRNLVGQMFREYFKIALPSPHTEGTIFESKRETGRTSGSPAASGAVFAKASHQNHKSELTTPLLVGAAGLAVGLGIFLALRQSKSSASKPLEKHADYPLYQRMQGSQIARG